MDFRIGHGYDVHALADSLPLVLGGVEIAHTKGCVAHSDGDVAIHALCDALLGAAALGDIGLHFPDTSADFAGIDSKILLRRVAELLREKGYEIGNVDCTIRAQQPRLRPHIDAMRRAMAGAMGVDDDRCRSRPRPRSIWASRGARKASPSPPWRLFTVLRTGNNSEFTIQNSELLIFVRSNTKPRRL